MKKKKIFKRVLISLLVLVIIATYFIGNFFIEYALVPNKGAENRQTVTSEIPEGVSQQDAEVRKNINENIKKTKDLTQKFIESIKDNTEEIVIESKEGFKLHGHKYLQKNPTNKWFVIAHGYQSSEKESNKFAYHLYQQGYNILTYNQRAMSPSEGSYITMGIKESDDLILWIEAIKEQYPDAQFALHGTSMGSATVLMASGKENLPKSVKAIIADCGYTSVWDIFKSELKQRFNLPSFPVLHMASLMGIPKANINLFSSEGSVVKKIEKSTTPTLFIHGTSDSFVPFPMVNELYDALKIDEKEKYVVEGAGHGEAQYVNPEEYYGKIEEFLKDKFD